MTAPVGLLGTLIARCDKWLAKCGKKTQILETGCLISDLRAAIATLPQQGCIGCGARVVVGYTIERKPGPFCHECWSALKMHVVQANLLNAHVDRPELDVALPPAPPQAQEPEDEEMQRHAFVPRGPTSPDIWCADCEYHRDHEIHRLAASPPAQELSPEECARFQHLTRWLWSPSHRAMVEWVGKDPARGYLKTSDVLAALPPAQGWQPLETAPKDGTTILLALNEYKIPSVDFGWHNGEYWRNYEGDVLSPGAWMPLPAPPVAAKETPQGQENKEDDTRVDAQ